ncbi:MAG: hypothetical protein ACRERD_23010 [Candidatus Binatia bacterium]
MVTLLKVVGIGMLVGGIIGCTKSLSPQLAPPAALISADRVAITESTERWGVVNVEAVHFPIPAEQLAALMVATVKQEGWIVEEIVRTKVGNDTQWIVQLRNGADSRLVSIVGVPQGGSKMEKEQAHWEGPTGFPSALLPQLKANVTAYLSTGKIPVTSGGS